MNLKNLFMINAVVALVFGVVFVLIPEQAMAQYGVRMLPKAGVLMARLFGGTLAVMGIVSWYAQSMNRDAQSGIMLAIVAGDGMGFIITLLAQLDGVTNNMGWSTVALYLILGLGFAYFRFMKPS